MMKFFKLVIESCKAKAKVKATAKVKVKVNGLRDHVISLGSSSFVSLFAIEIDT